MTHVFVSGEAGYFNYGDQGLSLAIVDRLMGYFPELTLAATGIEARTSVLFPIAEAIFPWPQPLPCRAGRMPRLLRRLFQQQATSPRRHFESSFDEAYSNDEVFRSAIRSMEKAAFILDIGHGSLNEIFGGLFLPYFYWLCHRVGKPLFVSGKSVGPLKDPMVVEAYRVGLRHAHTIILRDVGLSKTMLEDVVGLGGSVRLVEAGDDTLELKPVEPEWSRLPSAMGKMIRSGQFFAVQWRPTDYTRRFSTADYQLLASVICTLSARFGLRAVFVPTAWEQDPDILAAIALEALLPQGAHLDVLPGNLGARATKWILAQARFGIGLSYHFHLWLLSQGRPSIGIFTNPYYQIKTSGAFLACGYDATPLSFANVTKESVIESARAIETWSEEDSQTLMRNTTTMCEEWHTAFTRFLTDISVDFEGR